MPKNRTYTCNLCNKDYSGSSSLWNHTSKFHKVIKYDDDNTPIVSDHTLQTNDNTLIIQSDDSANKQIVTVKTYDCKYCKKIFNHFQNRWKHEKICKKKDQEIIPTNNNQNIAPINNINNGTINNTTNNTNNGTINNIVINNFNEDNLKYISAEFMKKVLDRLSRTDDESLKGAIPHLVENIKFNSNHTDNNNVQITNMKSKVAKKYVDNKWKYVKKDLLLKEMHNKAVEILQTWMDEHKEAITKKMMDGLKIYKNVSPEYKKKIIHEEIQLLGYNYYKNHMENELDA
jgi:hypothetical protein